MKKVITIAILAILTCVFTFQSKAQSPGPGNQPPQATIIPENNASPVGLKKGVFFLTPFYEFTSFKKLELISHTNNYKLWQGESSYDFTSDEIQEYNDNFDTEYNNSMTGLKVGYQAIDGLGISGYLGVNHVNFKSFISDENTQTINTNNPALTMGLAVDYKKAITDKLAAMAMISYNYCTTGSVAVDNTSGEDVTSSGLKSMYYEINLVLGYHLKKFLPYVGVGFTQQFVNSVHEEKILTTDDSGNEVFNYTEFDSHFRGSAIYGFAGLDYCFNKNLTIYVRSSFPNPVRANLGLRIVL